MKDKRFLFAALGHVVFVLLAILALLYVPGTFTKGMWGALVGVMFGAAGSYTMYLSQRGEPSPLKVVSSLLAIVILIIGIVIIECLGNA